MTKVLGNKIYKYLSIWVLPIILLGCLNRDVIICEDKSSVVVCIDFKGFEIKDLNNTTLIRKKDDVVEDTIKLEFDFNALRDAYLVNNKIFTSQNEVTLDTIHNYEIYIKSLGKLIRLKINKIDYSIKRAGFNNYRICEIKEYEIDEEVKTLSGIVVER